VNVELISESAWTSVIEGTRKIQFEFLALQLFLVNLRNRLRAKEISTQDCIRELKAFYRKFSRLPMAEQDFNKIANREETLTNQLLDPAETARRILAGESLMLAGEENLLAALPPGNWIGGTSPYFMAREGGCLCKDKIFVTQIPGRTQSVLSSCLRGVPHTPNLPCAPRRMPVSPCTRWQAGSLALTWTSWAKRRRRSFAAARSRSPTRRP
jgi:hypothetical protein